MSMSKTLTTRKLTKTLIRDKGGARIAKNRGIIGRRQP